MTNERPEPPELEETVLERRFWHLWFLLVAISILTTGGLAASISPLRGALSKVWPWQGTEAILLCGLYVVVVLFAGYLTLQQKRIFALRSGLRAVHRESNEDRRRHRNRMVALYTVSQAMGDVNDPQKVFDCITSMCKHVFDAERTSLMVLDEDREKMVVRSALGHPTAQQVIGHSQFVGEGIAGWVAKHRQPLLLGGPIDGQQFPGHQDRHEGLSSAMVIPLIVRDEVVGVLSVANREADVSYDEEDLTALRVFGEIAEYSIRHSEQTDWMRKLVENLRDPKESERPPENDLAREADFLAKIVDDLAPARPVVASPGFRFRRGGPKS